jgi:hypothetical protein
MQMTNMVRRAFVVETLSERLAPSWRDGEESRDVVLILWPNRINGVLEVQCQTQEIGIWLALVGRAEPSAKHDRVLAMRSALFVVVIRIAAALGLTRLIATFLFGVAVELI